MKLVGSQCRFARTPTRSSLAPSLLLISLSISLMACVTGTGTRTLIKDKSTDSFLRERYPHLIAPLRATDADRIVYFDDSGEARIDDTVRRQARLEEFNRFMEAKYGDSNFVPLVLHANVHDRTIVPSFLPVDFRTPLATSLFASNMTPSEQERRFVTLVNQPDIYSSTTQHAREDRFPIYHYFPRLSVDFSSSITSASPLDRIAFLLMVIRLTTDEQVRFTNFSPKDTDFVDFTRGQYTQTVKGAISANTSIQVTSSSTSDTGTVGRNSGIGVAPGMTFSDSYVTALADAIERRSTGLLDPGTFYAAFRSLREVRIGGTYNFDLMLEVPSIERGPCEVTTDGSREIQYWKPIANEVRADIYLLGVMRHVHDRGRLGFFTKVPESENDDVYEQVVVKTIDDVLLWSHTEYDWVGSRTRGRNSKCVEPGGGKSDGRDDQADRRDGANREP